MTQLASPSLTSLTTDADAALPAALRSAVMVQTTVGDRQLRLTVRARDTVRATATLTRAGRTIVVSESTLPAGSRIVKLTVPPGAGAGDAELRFTLSDDAAHTRTYTRRVRLDREAVVAAT